MQTSLAHQRMTFEASPGHAMLMQLQSDLGKLSPPLRRVAQYCIEHAHGLHRMGIQEVAQASQTIPAAVVRLAQRYGLKGFRELKLAFLPTLPISAAQASGAPWCPSDSQHTAISYIEKMAADIAQIQSEILRPEFSRVVQALQGAERVIMTRPTQSLAYLHQRLIHGLGIAGIETHELGEELPRAGDLWIILPTDLTPTSRGTCRGNRAYRQVFNHPNALHFIGFRSTGFTLACELIASFRTISTQQDPFKTVAFCDALGRVVAH